MIAITCLPYYVFFQIFTGFLLLGISPLLHPLLISGSAGFFLLTPFFILLVLAVTAVINFSNFMDGLDGLVAGCMTVSIGALTIILDSPGTLFVLVGSLFGFLVWNWSPAKVFMGDVGSTFLGAVFSGLVLQAAVGLRLSLTFWLPLLWLMHLCVPRRLLAGQRVFQAHSLHLFQRLPGWLVHSCIILHCGTLFSRLHCFLEVCLGC